MFNFFQEKAILHIKGKQVHYDISDFHFKISFHKFKVSMSVNQVQTILKNIDS